MLDFRIKWDEEYSVPRSPPISGSQNERAQTFLEGLPRVKDRNAIRKAVSSHSEPVATVNVDFPEAQLTSSTAEHPPVKTLLIPTKNLSIPEKFKHQRSWAVCGQGGKEITSSQFNRGAETVPGYQGQQQRKGAQHQTEGYSSLPSLVITPLLEDKTRNTSLFAR